MNSAKRLISGALSLLMVWSLCVAALPAWAAEADSPLTGSIGLTLRFDLPQRADEAAGRKIRLKVTGAGGTVSLPLPSGNVENTLHAGIWAEADNIDGAPLGRESYVGFYKAELTGLPAGQEYTVALTGTGYVPFETTVKLDGYSKHLTVGTGDATFSLGDVNGDGKVDGQDLTAMDAMLDKKPTDEELARFDLDGDGKVDITDLTYVNYNQRATGKARVLDTAAIVPAALSEGAEIDVLKGKQADLFRDGGDDVALKAAEGAGALVLPIEFGGRTVEMSQIQIVCPDVEGAIQAGTAEVELDNGGKLTVPFDTTPPEGVHAIGRTAGQRVVTIDLGNKVAVKKITITVTATAGGDADYAVVRKIEFLKDIVPDAPKNDQPQILSAVPGNGQVTLEWTSVRNITGYVIDYGTGGKLDKQITSTATKAAVTGLENLKTYQFRVTAVNGSWKGVSSEPVSATPEPGSAPGAPSNISVTAADQSLRLSWGKTKDAAFYQVFYREAGQSEFVQSGGDLTGTSAFITGLENGVTYQVAVKAGNSKGVGPYSAIATGTPQREELAMPHLPEEDRLSRDQIQSVVMADPGNVDRKLCPGFAVEQVVDDDAATYWVAKNWPLDSHFTYTFAQPQDMNYAILVPYLAGNHKYALNTYTVTARDAQGEVLLSETLYSAPAMDAQKGYLVLPFTPVEGVKSLTIALNEREGNGCRVSISEMAFYKSDSLAQDIAALFTDGSFTALRSGVTAEEIEALSARLEAKKDFYLDLVRLRDELDLAQSLLGNGAALGLVKTDFQARAGSKDSKYGQSASDLQPLGVTARAGATVAVYAQLPDDAPVYVVPTQYFGESGIWRGQAVRLENGRNYITVPKIGSLEDERGGPLYLTYAGSDPEAIKIQVRVDKDSFVMPVLELSGWYELDEAGRRAAIQTYVAELERYVGALGSAGLDTDIRNATEISTPSVLLSIPASQALAGLRGGDMADALYDDVLAWEDVLFVANQVQGIVPAGASKADYQYPMTTRQNIRYMRMFAGAFMYAAGNHVGVGWGSTTGLVCGAPVSKTGAGQPNRLFGWGIAHEIGHNMDKLGKAEITNNIYALAVQAYDGGSMAMPTRLTKSNIWPAVYDKTSSGRPGSAGNVFVQLAMYWQLHLGYDGADRPLEFYQKFFTAWKSGAHSGRAHDDRVALIAAEVVDRDLSEFFTRWGMDLSEDVEQTLKSHTKESRALWYLNDGSYAARLNGGQKADMTAVAVSAQVEENRVVLTITGGTQDVLGYEIRRSGAPIVFTTESTYTDDLGPANNRTYTYSVVPVDKLGNMGQEASAGEVRVAWDTEIEAGRYTAAWEGDVFTAVMDKKVPVTGVKIAGEGLSGAYKVEVKTAASDWAVVREGQLAEGETVGYFTKPGADPAQDTRIWTYDVTGVRVTLPQGTKEAGEVRIALLADPGDRVDFYPGATVGRLQEDYKYGDGPDEVIAAGTVVVLGTYRGDPNYNAVEIEVRYSTEAEAAEPGDEAGEDKGFVERAMSGYALLFAEVPESGKVGDISDGFWLFVPDLEAEETLNEEAGISQKLDVEDAALGERVSPSQIRAVFYRTDDGDAQNRQPTSETQWVSFPDYETLPLIELTGAGLQ
ncbi:MAG: hypothetical protein HFF21_03290 [Oscillospiraceae bacterium]|nr:hypothetical protein [Oscillospiraceae bacterium]